MHWSKEISGAVGNLVLLRGQVSFSSDGPGSKPFKGVGEDVKSALPDESTRAVWAALLMGLGVALANVGAAVVTSSPAMAAEASHSVADTANEPHAR